MSAPVNLPALSTSNKLYYFKLPFLLLPRGHKKIVSCNCLLALMQPKPSLQLLSWKVMTVIKISMKLFSYRDISFRSSMN